jgi:quinol monooxygenase YgiN
MIVEYVRYELKTHTAQALIDAYAHAGEHLRAAPECLGYELTQCEEAPTSLVLRILWQSSEAHTLGFRKGPCFPPFLALIRPFIEEIAEMRHYAKTPVEWSRG